MTIVEPIKSLYEIQLRVKNNTFCMTIALLFMSLQFLTLKSQPNVNPSVTINYMEYTILILILYLINFNSKELWAN